MPARKRPTDQPPKAAELHNRITRQETVAPGKLRANSKNWRTHPEAQAAVMRSMLNRIGWVAPVMVNERTGNIVDGHLRVQIAIEDGIPAVPVDYVDLTPAEEETVLAAYDPLSALAGVDPELQATLLLNLQNPDDDLGIFLEQQAAEAAAVVGAMDMSDDDDDEPGEKRAGWFRRSPDSVKAVVSVSDVPRIERALAATGVLNRGDALLQLCNYYLAQHGHLDPAELEALEDEGADVG